MNPTYDFHDRVAVEVGARGRAMFSRLFPLKPYSSVLSHAFNGHSYRPVLGATSRLQ